MQRLGELFRRWIAILADNLAGERDRWILWLPVAMGAGVAVYFDLSVEPPLWLGLAALAAAALRLVLLLRRPRLWRRPVLRLLCLGVLHVVAVLGFAAAELRTATVEAPMLAERLKGVEVRGRVREVEFLPTGRRLRLDEVTIEGIATPPAQIRLKLALDYPLLVPGDRVRMRATLAAPSRPVAPGSYDFRRDLFFDRIGAVGVGYGRVGVTPAAGGEGALLRSVWQGFAELRALIEGRILAAIPDRDTAGVAVAFATGSQSAVPKDVLQAMRDSGLAHLLSVSGLHGGLVAGILFFLSRAMLALVPPIALRYPIKKWAAGLALAGAVFYTLLSGASVPVVRTCLMAGVALFAVICDRQPISMRLVAWAAAVVLLLWPDSLIGPSFQLSFAAIIALIAMWEEIAPGRRPESSPWRRGLIGMRDMVLTSLIATLATAAFGIYHFNRFTGYGVVANMLAVPITGFWVMPFLILSLLLMPFGLESLALAPAGWGIEAILWTAQTVAGWPGAVSVVRAMPPVGIALVSLGGLCPAHAIFATVHSHPANHCFTISSSSGLSVIVLACVRHNSKVGLGVHHWVGKTGGRGGYQETLRAQGREADGAGPLRRWRRPLSPSYVAGGAILDIQVPAWGSPADDGSGFARYRAAGRGTRPSDRLSTPTPGRHRPD